MKNECANKGEPHNFYGVKGDGVKGDGKHFICNIRHLSQQTDCCGYPDYFNDPEACTRFRPITAKGEKLCGYCNSTNCLTYCPYAFSQKLRLRKQTLRYMTEEEIEIEKLTRKLRVSDLMYDEEIKK